MGGGSEGARPPASDSVGEGSVGKHLRLGRTQKRDDEEEEEAQLREPRMRF